VPEGVDTLAEILGGAGYRTVAFTANPYNSRSRGTHQGFEEFVEMWGEPAHLMAERAAEVLASQAAGEPLFLSLHMVPPHEPYDPTPEFDLFGNPEYSGPMEPGLLLRDFREGRMPLDATDFAEVEALYDGNLRRGDDAVGQVLDAARAAGRYRDALVLVISDHGEAFLEHGHQGHNTTLYEEMLHIPFILRLPGGERPAAVDIDRLVTLSDVLPTVLGRLGLETPEGSNGVDVLSAPDPDRVLVQRIPRRQAPLWSTVSGRFKTIAQPHFRHQELYDLGQDPGELENLVFEHPLLFAGFQQLRRLEQARVVDRQLEAGDADLTTQEEDTLRSLGYLD
jgi:arylsulfatase A-like enzyme